MKFASILIVSVLLTVAFGTAVRNIHLSSKPNLISPLVAGVSTSQENTSDLTDNISGWQIFINNYYGYKIKHPAEVVIKNYRNGDITLQKSNSINIFITQDILTENDTINTFIEKAIDIKKNELKDKFTLLTKIIPIALGSVTGQMFTTLENGEKNTYYYVPQQDKKFIMITNKTANNGSVEYLTSEKIIYSLINLP